MTTNTNPNFVDVVFVTYNHAKFIREALDSVVMQRLNNQWRILVVDDCSTDGTQDIIHEFASRHLGLIYPYISKKNIGLNGVVPYCWEVMRDHCKAKYIAVIEGDDYWTDPLKLQKQVDFLEAHPEYSMCLHNTALHWEETVQINILREKAIICDKSELTTLDALRKNPVCPVHRRTHISGAVFRSKILQGYPLALTQVCNGDHALILWASLCGKIRVLKDIMSVWRRHAGGLSIRRRTTETPYDIKRRIVHMYEVFRSILPKQYDDECHYIINAVKYTCDLNALRAKMAQSKRDHCVYVWKHCVQNKYDNIALLGAGGHSQMLLEALASARLLLPVTIFDSNPKVKEISNIPVAALQEHHKYGIDAIVLSTETFQDSMRESIQNAFSSQPPVIDLYC